MIFSGKRVLVTGGAGFVGSHVVEALLQEGALVTILDNLTTGFRHNIPKASPVHVIEGDVQIPAHCEAAVHDQDFVFHLSANADVRNGLLHPWKDTYQNIIATQTLLEAMRKAGVKDIAFPSSGSVYGDTAIIPTPEDAPFPIQTSLYAATKVAAEGILSAYAAGYGFRPYIFRFVSLLGPRYSHGHILDFWKQLKKDSTRLSVLGDGYQKKSYLHIDDCVRAMFRAIDHYGRGSACAWPRIHNLGTNDWFTVRQSIEVICKTMGVTPEISFQGGDRGWVGDSPKILLDTTRIRILGWEARRTIAEGVADTVQHLETHADVFLPRTDAEANGSSLPPTNSELRTIDRRVGT